MAGNDRNVWPARVAFLAASAALTTSIWGAVTSGGQAPLEPGPAIRAIPAAAAAAAADLAPEPTSDVRGDEDGGRDRDAEDRDDDGDRGHSGDRDHGRDREDDHGRDDHETDDDD